MIYLVSEISINGQGGKRGNPFFGGYIYDISYDISTGSQGSSSVRVSLINESGSYSFNTTNLNITQAYQINIGSINLLMYAKSFRKKYSARGYILEIEFTDGSFRLDKYFVGLHKKHGWNPLIQGPITLPFFSANPSCFIIVGHEFHPCDVNYKGNSNFINDIKDPCHPCQQEQIQINQAKVVDCKRMSRYNIFEVKYNFTELLTALKIAGFNFDSTAIDPNPSYYKDHTGTVREVLSAWCNHFGWIFFWENGLIKFKDLRTVQTVNATINSFCPNIENYEEEVTLDGTFDKMVLTNFTRPGHDENYDCNNAVYLQIPAYSQTSIPASGLAITQKIDADAAGLAYYDKELRDLYYLFIKYKMDNPGKYSAGKEIPELGLTILSDAITISGAGSQSGIQGGVIEPSTNLNKPAFSNFRSNLDDPISDETSDFLTSSNVGRLESARNAIKENQAFLECFQLLDPETQWKVAGDLSKYFFFVGHYDPKTDDANYQKELDFAQNFIGKYHVFVPDLGSQNQKDFFEDYTFYQDTTACGQYLLKNDDKVTYDFLGNTTGDNLEYLNNLGQDGSGQARTLSSLPFARFLTILQNQPSGGGPIRQLKMVVVEKGGPSFYPPNISATADSSSIFPNSGNNWFIQDSAIKNQAHTYYPKVLPTATSPKGDSVTRLILGDQQLNGVDRNKTYIFLGYAQRDLFQYRKSNGYHPAAKGPIYFNGDPLNLEIDPVTNKPDKDLIYRYPEFKCANLGEISGGACQIVNFTSPAGVFKFYLPVEGAYACVLQKSRKVLKRFNKQESILVTGNCNSGNTLSLDVQSINITDQDITKFLKIANNSCIFDNNAIAKLHTNYAKNLGASQKEPLIKRVFTIQGLLKDSLGIKDGLQGISISADENGVKSTYTFGTTHFLLPDPDIYSDVRDNINILDWARSNDINASPQLK